MKKSYQQGIVPSVNIYKRATATPFPGINKSFRGLTGGLHPGQLTFDIAVKLIIPDMITDPFP
jgi:hypothetical protein